jgi:hypothetical protein
VAGDKDSKGTSGPPWRRLKKVDQCVSRVLYLDTPAPPKFSSIPSSGTPLAAKQRHGRRGKKHSERTGKRRAEPSIGLA